MPEARFVDMHAHTSFSDGVDTPTQLVAKAAKLNLAAIAVTDHDTLDGLDEAEVAGKKYNIEVIRGCELSVKSRYGEIHILGFWVASGASKLEEAFKRLQKFREERNVYLIDRLNKLGFPLQYEDVLAQSSGRVVGRLHFAQTLVLKGYSPTIGAAFKKFLGYDGLAYAPRDTFGPKEAISLLVEAGAMVSFAHPMLIPCPRAWLEERVRTLKDYGLSAIEAYHSEHSRQDERYCVDLAARYNLGITGGSDYHGSVKPNVFLGGGRGKARMTKALLNVLKERRQRSCAGRYANLAV